MTQELGNTDQLQEQRSLVVRGETSDLNNFRHTPFLEIAGFSPQLPQRLMMLNDVLPAQRLRRVGIELQPGQTPVFSSALEYDTFRGYRVFINGYPQREKAEVAIDGNGKAVTIEDIKNFVSTCLPSVNARLQTIASPHLIEPIEDFDKDLQAVTEEELRTWFEERPAYESSGQKIGDDSLTLPYSAPNADVVIEGQKLQLFVLNLMMMHYDPNTVGCEISNNLLDRDTAFYYYGAPQDVERVIDGLITLFGKQPYPIYPYKLPERGKHK